MIQLASLFSSPRHSSQHYITCMLFIIVSAFVLLTLARFTVNVKNQSISTILIAYISIVDVICMGNVTMIAYSLPFIIIIHDALPREYFFFSVCCRHIYLVLKNSYVRKMNLKEGKCQNYTTDYVTRDGKNLQGRGGSV